VASHGHKACKTRKTRPRSLDAGDSWQREGEKRRGERKVSGCNAEATHALDTPCFRWHVLGFSRAHPAGPCLIQVCFALVLFKGCGLHGAVPLKLAERLKLASGGLFFASYLGTIWAVSNRRCVPQFSMCCALLKIGEGTFCFSSTGLPYYPLMQGTFIPSPKTAR